MSKLEILALIENHINGEELEPELYDQAYDMCKLALAAGVVPKSKEFEYHKLYADRGIAEAQVIVCGCYFHCESVKKDHREAFKYAKLAADQGSPHAQYFLGSIYDGQLGEECRVPVNKEKAFQLFKTSADKGLCLSQQAVAQCYLIRNGVKASLSESFKYFKKAADQGCKECLYNVGGSYYKGIGVPQNKKEAMKYIKISADLGFEEAKDIIRTCRREERNPCGI